jgi:hypothetical protein
VAASTIAAKWRCAPSATAGSRALARFFCSSNALGVRGSSSSPMKARSTIAAMRSALSLSAGIAAWNLSASALKPDGPARGCELLLEIAHHELLHALAMGDTRLVGRVEHADGELAEIGHPPSRVDDQRRVARERLVAAPEAHLLGQVAEIPRGCRLALDAGTGLREREARGLAQALPQLGQVARHRELALGLVHDADVHEQVRRRILLRPDVRVEALAGDARGVLQHRSCTGARPAPCARGIS